MEKLVVENSIEINAPAVKVWDMLVNPEKTKQYMFGCEAISGWKVGDPLLWKGNYEGKEVVFVRGNVLEFRPGQLLKYTVIDPNASYPDIPANYLNVTYELKEVNSHTILRVIQDGFESAADGEKRYKETYNNGEGWNPILVQIKKLAEQ